jgi:hypothetical protein
MVMDWAGAFNTALNTALKMRQLGLENEWKERSAKLAEDTFLLEKEKARADITKAEAETKRQRDELTFKQTQWKEGERLRQLQLDQAQSALNLAAFDLQQKTEGAAAASDLADFIAGGNSYGYDTAIQNLAVNNDIVARNKSRDSLQAFSTDQSNRGIWADIGRRAKDPVTLGTLKGWMSSAEAVNASLNDKRHDTGVERTVVEIDDNANVPAALRAVTGKVFDELPTAMQDEVMRLAQTPGVKIKRFPGETVKYSDNDIIAGIRRGDPRMARLFLRESKASEAEALSFLKNNYGGDLSMIQLHDVVPPTSDFDSFRKEPPDVANAITPLLAKFSAPSEGLLGSAKKAVPTGGIGTDGKPTVVLQDVVGPDGKPMTNADVLRDAWDGMVKANGYPEMVRQQGLKRINDALRQEEVTKDTLSRQAQLQANMQNLSQEQRDVIQKTIQAARQLSKSVTVQPQTQTSPASSVHPRTDVAGFAVEGFSPREKEILRNLGVGIIDMIQAAPGVTMDGIDKVNRALGIGPYLGQ